MRRGFAFLLAVSTLGSMASSALGQYPYPYPYGPMPVQYAPQHGYPMPAYVPGPMPSQPMYYPQAPMMQPPGRNTKVFVYGPLMDDAPQSAPAAVPANFKPAPNPIVAVTPESTPTEVTQAQIELMRGGAHRLSTYSKQDLAPEACGSDCDACPPTGCARPCYEAPMRGRGHFIGDTGAYFLVPVGLPRPAFTTTANGATTTTEFPHQVDFGPRFSIGYLFHSGWGVRADYDYLRGSLSQSALNFDATTTLATPPVGPFIISSPGTSLNSGIGADQFHFTQSLERHIADVELIKESCLLDTTLLFGVGARYARLTQTYSATRINQGGSNGAVNVAVDREDLDSTNRYEGFGPTVSLEAIHPLRCGFSIYGDIRGAFMFGTDQLSRSYHLQNRSVTAAGVANFTDTSLNSDVRDVRYVSILETEAGLQYGCRVGRCYLFARAGLIFQRWFDVGSATTPSGNLTFIGGTARMGITY